MCVYRSLSGGKLWEALTKGLPQENCIHNVLRDALLPDEAADIDDDVVYVFLPETSFLMSNWEPGFGKCKGSMAMIYRSYVLVKGQ